MDITAAHRSSVPSSFSWALQLCCSHAGSECTSWCPARAGVTQCNASAPSSLCLTHAQSPALLSFVPRNQRNSGLRGQSSLHLPKVMTEEQGSSLLAAVLLAQFAQFAKPGSGQLLPLGSHKHRAMSCPNALAGSAASLGASVPPFTSDAHHTRHKLPIQKANKCHVWRHQDLLCMLEIGGTGEGRRHGFAEVPQEPTVT